MKFHLANVYRKLGVRSRFEAAKWARENGILDVVVDSGEAISMAEPKTNGDRLDVAAPAAPAEAAAEQP